MKKVKWNAKARDFVRSLSNEAKREIGSLLLLIQSGRQLGGPQSKPMKSIHAFTGATQMRLTKAARQLAQDLDLNDVDAYIMELKANLYGKSSDLIQASKKTHEEIAKSIGTSRSRINRIANHGESNVSIELLIKIITVLEGKPAIKIAA